MEGILVIARWRSNGRLRLAPGHQVRLHPTITLRPKRGMPMTLERR